MKHPHDPNAATMYTNLVFNNFENLMKFVTELKLEKLTSKIINEVILDFEIVGRYIEISYQTPEGEYFFTREKFKSRKSNNSPNEELLLAVARAEVNALLYKKGRNLKLWIYPNIGFYA
jgi:type IV secretory pathway ATPase VirB11/archaellum biosynthesis ATPase